LPFADADAEIEAAHAGITIPEIFAKYGEPYFRDGEARVIARLLGEGPRVLATGGGAYMRKDTRERIRDHAVSIWLKVDRDVILRRIKRRTDRPLLQTDDPGATIDRLIAERNPLYREADIMVPSRDVPHDRIVDESIGALRSWLGRERVTAATATLATDTPR
jgi:shikimate kinase